jgi:hypothetical protein
MLIIISEMIAAGVNIGVDFEFYIGLILWSCSLKKASKTNWIQKRFSR